MFYTFGKVFFKFWSKGFSVSLSFIFFYLSFRKQLVLLDEGRADEWWRCFCSGVLAVWSQLCQKNNTADPVLLWAGSVNCAAFRRWGTLGCKSFDGLKWCAEVHLTWAVYSFETTITMIPPPCLLNLFIYFFVCLFIYFSVTQSHSLSHDLDIWIPSWWPSVLRWGEGLLINN